MTIDEAKKIVLEKYPDAYHLNWRIWTKQKYVCIGDGNNENSAWLSAANRIQKEKDK